MGLGLVQPPHGQQQGDAFGGVEAGPVNGPGVLRGGGEVGNAVHPARRPALGHDPVGDMLGIGDQGVEALVIFEVVIAAQAADPRPGAPGGMPGGAVHPGQGEVGVVSAGEAACGGCGEEVQGAAEPELPDWNPGVGQGRMAGGVGAQGCRLRLSRPRQPCDQVDEIGLRAAFAGRSQEMQDAHRRDDPIKPGPASQAA